MQVKINNALLKTLVSALRARTSAIVPVKLDRLALTADEGEKCNAESMTQLGTR
jgi:hypothetical protein